MRHRRFLSLLLVGGLVAVAGAQNAGGVSRDLLGKLNTGVNVTRWFCYLDDPADTAHYETYFTAADMANLKRLKVGFVRLCVSPEAIYQDGVPNAKTLPFLDRAIERLESAGMAVLLDLHDNGQLKLDEPGHDNAGFIRFWEAMARHYAGKRESRTVFELLNEPQFNKNPEVWYALQAKSVAAIRTIDPKRPVMVTSTSWSGVDAFAQMKPLPQKNLVYTFHCYDPFLFTHQGASWAGDQQKALREIPFPSSPEAVAAMINVIPTAYQDAVRRYGEERHDAKDLRDRVAKAMAFRDRYHVPVVMGEFGAYPPVALPEDRTRWFAAMRKAVDELRVPNAVWGYDDALGLGRKVNEDGTVTLDPVCLSAFYGMPASTARTAVRGSR